MILIDKLKNIRLDRNELFQKDMLNLAKYIAKDTNSAILNSSICKIFDIDFSDTIYPYLNEFNKKIYIFPKEITGSINWPKQYMIDQRWDVVIDRIYSLQKYFIEKIQQLCLQNIIDNTKQSINICCNGFGTNQINLIKHALKQEDDTKILTDIIITKNLLLELDELNNHNCLKDVNIHCYENFDQIYNKDVVIGISKCDNGFIMPIKEKLQLYHYDQNNEKCGFYGWIELNAYNLIKNRSIICTMKRK